MAVAKSSEFQKIALIRRGLAGVSSGQRVELGIGDDAAVLDIRGRLIVSVDAQIENQHFRRAWISLEDIGYRSFQAALSDLAAMGARPVAALANLALPSHLSDRELQRIVRGQAEAARACGCPLVGGNLSRSTELSIVTTALGEASAPLLRRGARPGDELWLIGDVGLARAGFIALSRGLRGTGPLRVCVEAWRRPRARLAEGRRLIGRATSAIDVSDGLAGDARHLANASRVRVVLDADRLGRALSPDLIRAAARLDLAPLSLALEGGEDYALLATGLAERRPRGAKAIGRIEQGRGVFVMRAGKQRRLGASFDHFA